MSEVNPDVDLQGLRRTESAPIVKPRRWHLYIIPLLILVGIVALAWDTLRDFWEPRHQVVITRPQLGELQTVKGQVLLQAAGWVEPDPFPVRVTPLIKGVVKEVLVQESEAVKAGQAVAHLHREEEELRWQEAEAAVKRAEAYVASLEPAARIAKESFDAALDFREKLERALADHEGFVAEAKHRDASVIKAEAALSVADDELKVQQHLQREGASGPRQVEIAEGIVKERRGDLEVMKADAALARANAKKAKATLDRMTRDKDLRFEEVLRMENAEKALSLARAQLEEARSKAATLKLLLDRTIVRAPCDGIVLERMSVPGSVVDPASGEAPAICSLFDPTEVRVRVDVPQDVVARVQPDQDAEIIAETRRDRPYKGRVIRIVQQADINKVTLQVHVCVLEADDLLKPEMLCQVRFLASTDTSTTQARVAEVMLIPRALVQDGHVWVVDSTGRRAERRAVTVLPGTGDQVQVSSGLTAVDKIISSGTSELKDGSLIEIGGGN